MAAFFLIILFVGSVLNVRRTKATVIRNTNNWPERNLCTCSITDAFGFSTPIHTVIKFSFQLERFRKKIIVLTLAISK